MERFLFISPAIVAILIFVYMRNRQAKRNDKMRKRFWKKEKDLMDMLANKTDQQNINNNDN